MPPLTFIKILGNLKFMSHSLKLPSTKGIDPFSKGFEHSAASDKDYKDAFQPADKIAIPQLIPPWFMPQEPNKYYQDSCDKIGKQFKSFHDDMLDAVGYSHNMWKLQVKIKDLKVMAICAIGTPGCLDGPELEDNIKNAPMVASYSGNAAKWRDAVAKGVSKCFKKWQDKVMVPGLPWWPAFAAFPGPTAPPMPNIPMPLITCVSAMMTEIIMPSSMKDAMVDALDSGLKDKDPDKQHEAMFDSIATVLSLAFLMWLPQQMAMLIMGKGPIPTFAPPFVPVGPVLAGDNIAAPSHLMA